MILQKVQLERPPKIMQALKGMEISDDQALKFDMDAFKAVHSSIHRLKSFDMKFTTRKINGMLYVWRVE